MSALDKIKNVTNGLDSCGTYSHLCSTCPYNRRGECEKELHKDALEVINALRNELKKGTSKAVEAKPGFITLTRGIYYYSDRQCMMYEHGRIAIRVSDILSVSDLMDAKGSEVRLNYAQQTTFYVCETIEEILGKVANMRGEEE